MTDELERLLELVKDIQMTPAQQEEQRRSFAYGNTKFANDLITRQMIDEALAVGPESLTIAGV